MKPTSDEIEEVRSETGALLPDELRDVVNEYGLDIVGALINDIYEVRPLRLMAGRIDATAEELFLASADLGSVARVPFGDSDFLIASFTVDGRDMTVYHHRFSDGNVLSFPFVRTRGKWEPLFFAIQCRTEGLSPLQMTSELPKEQFDKFENFFDQDDSLRLAAYMLGSLMLFHQHGPETLH